MPRQRLPNRRPAVNGVLRHGNREFILSVGFTTQGRAAEVFLDGHKTGSDAELLVDDLCIVLSMLLQFGARPEKILAALQRPGRDGDADRSLIEALLEQVTRIEADGGAIVREIETARAQRTIDAIGELTEGGR